MTKQQNFKVSIHAPARGATCLSRQNIHGQKFQSTPLHEGRLVPWRDLTGPERFNPRPCTRGDVLIPAPAECVCRFNPRPCTRGDTPLEDGLLHLIVSIHAPARGATHDNIISTIIALTFQSTPLHEGRQTASLYKDHVACFNPRPCTRGDIQVIIGLNMYSRFNPRPCTRGDIRS